MRLSIVFLAVLFCWGGRLVAEEAGSSASTMVNDAQADAAFAMIKKTCEHLSEVNGEKRTVALSFDRRKKILEIREQVSPRTFAALRWYVFIYLEKVDPGSIGPADAGAEGVKYSGFAGAPATARCSFAVLTAPDRDGYVLHAWNEARSEQTILAFRNLVSWAQDPSR